MNMLFKVDLVDATFFIEAKDWEGAIKKAQEMAAKIFAHPTLNCIRVAGSSYSKYRGVWV